MSGNVIRVFLVVAALVLAIGLFLAPSQVNVIQGGKLKSDSQNSSFDYKGLIKTAKASLDEKQRGEIMALEMTLDSKLDSLPLYDSIGLAWDRANIPAVSAYYFELKAEKNPSERNYLEAAYRFFDAYKIAADTNLRTYMVQQAIINYQKVIEINPSNLNAKTDLGVCYAEGTSEPMKGILMLREVVAADPNHEMAQFNLGLLSLKSTQFPKAIDRFDKVIAINPKRTDVYLYKAQTYMQMGDTMSAVKSFEEYKVKSDDYEMIQQVSKYLDQLKSGSTLKATS